MTSPVSRDRLDAIRAWLDDEPDSAHPGVPVLDTLLVAAAYALNADDRIAALEAEVAALNDRIAALEAEVTAFRDGYQRVVGAKAADAAERDALAATIAKVRATATEDAENHWYAGELDHRCIDVADVLAILDGEAP